MRRRSALLLLLRLRRGTPSFRSSLRCAQTWRHSILLLRVLIGAIRHDPCNPLRWLLASQALPGSEPLLECVRKTQWTPSHTYVLLMDLPPDSLVPCVPWLMVRSRAAMRALCCARWRPCLRLKLVEPQVLTILALPSSSSPPQKHEGDIVRPYLSASAAQRRMVIHAQIEAGAVGPQTGWVLVRALEAEAASGGSATAAAKQTTPGDQGPPVLLHSLLARLPPLAEPDASSSCDPQAGGAAAKKKGGTASGRGKGSQQAQPPAATARSQDTGFCLVSLDLLKGLLAAGLDPRAKSTVDGGAFVDSTLLHVCAGVGRPDYLQVRSLIQLASGTMHRSLAPNQSSRCPIKQPRHQP